MHLGHASMPCYVDRVASLSIVGPPGMIIYGVYFHSLTSYLGVVCLCLLPVLCCCLPGPSVPLPACAVLTHHTQIYLAILTVRVLLSWFRNIDWFTEPWNTLRQVGEGRPTASYGQHTYTQHHQQQK